MKKEIEYHEVQMTFLVRTREAKRVTKQAKTSDVRSELATLVADAITGNETDCMDAEDISVTIDGKAILGAER